MLYLLLLFLLITHISANISLPKIYGHFKNGTQIEICQDVTVKCTEVADSYTVGEGSEEFLVWTPFGETGIAGEHVGNVLARALRQLVLETRNNMQEDTIKGRIVVKSWSDMAYTPICNDSSTECPTVMILGTTQFAYRSKLGDIKVLDNYFDKYLSKMHEPLTDSFLKQVYYDYNIDSHFMAVPLILDIRLLYFNRTTFDELRLKYPPPLGNWGGYSKPYYEEWTWKTFVDYIRIIRQKYPNDPAFSFTGQYDEEMKLFHMIIRNYFIETIDENKTCGYLNNKETVLGIINDIIKPIFSQLGDDWYPHNEETISFLKNNRYIAPEDLPKICCRDTSVYSNGFLGFTIDSPNSMRKVNLFDSEENVNGEIAAGFIPGSTSYLGGSGIVISNNIDEKMQDIAWNYILMLINKTNDYLTDIGIATNMMPPYDSLFDIRYWNEKKWDTPKSQIRNSLQIQYPRQTFPEFGELEDRHPIRLMMLEIMKKDIDPSEAVDRCCQLINSVLAGECSDKHWTYSISECTSFQNRKIQFKWINSSCKGGVTLPKDNTISCSYISPRSGFGGSMIVFSILGIILSLIYMALFIKYRNTEPIKKAPLNFSIIVILGSMLNFTYVIFSTGQPSEFKCIFSKWLLVLGFGLSFSGFAVKLKKIYEMYRSRDGHAFSSDIKLYRIIFGVLLLDAIALIIWTSVNSPLSSLTQEEYKANSRTILYTVNKCNSFHDQKYITIFFIYFFNISTLIYGLWLSFKTWTIPQSYSETKFVGTSLFIAALAIVVVIPLIWFSNSYEMNYLIKSLILNFATAISLSVFCVPKLRSAYYYSKIMYNKKRDIDDQVSNPLNDKIISPFCCPNCGVLVNSFNEFKFPE